MLKQFLLLLCLGLCLPALSTTNAQAQPATATHITAVAFAHGGKFKMLYDCRQRPQSVLLKDRLYLVYNGEAKPTKSDKGSAYPMLIIYRPPDRSFSK
ncbi:MAG: hypothetical protein VB857_02550, partial [Pirellulaceae bacterium]